MTTKIRIPSSETPPPLRSSGSRAKSGRLATWVGGTMFVVVGIVIIFASLDAVPPGGEDAIPEPFPVAEINTVQSETVLSSSVPTVVTLRGSGTTLAAGVVGSSQVAVTTDLDEVIVWTVIDGAWSYAGQIDGEIVGSVRVTDDRVIAIGADRNAPAVWEWVDGRTQLLFQPPSGWIIDAWSVDSRLLVVTSSDTQSEPAEAVRYGRRDELWQERDDGTFTPVELENLSTILAVSHAEGSTLIGGSDDGQPAIGYLVGDRVLAERIPTEADFAGVTDVEVVVPDSLALISIFDASSVIASEIRAAGQDWGVVAVSPRRLEIDRIGGRIVTIDEDGAVSDLASGVQVSAPPFANTGGTVSGMAVNDGSPLVYGSSHGQPALAFWGDGARLVSIPEGSWRRYHSESSDGYRLVHVGAREFAVRGTDLFMRAWNADRWHPTEFDGPAEFFGDPQIIDSEWGYVLSPLVEPGLWRSSDGQRWDLASVPSGRTAGLMTDGSNVVALSTVTGGLDGPSTEVAIVTSDTVQEAASLPFATVLPGWDPTVGFFASIFPGREIGFVTSEDGVDWTRHSEDARYDIVAALDGGLYWSSGEPATTVGPPVELPGDASFMYSFPGGVAVARSVIGTTWIWGEGRWTSVGLGVADGLPGRPIDLVIRDGVLYAFVESGVSREVWALDLG